MTRRYTIAEARSRLPTIVDEAEAGLDVELTRRGEPVAALVSLRELERLRGKRLHFKDAYTKFLATHSLEEIGVKDDVWHELTYGCRRLPRGKRRAVREAYLRDVVRGCFPNLPYDEAAATWHGEERARLEALGQPAPFVDGQIAAIAHVHGLVLVTTNDQDFVQFDGLRVGNWSKRQARLKT
jgi:tRNA(fMet)-specific endonuclease VapC